MCEIVKKKSFEKNIIKTLNNISNDDNKKKLSIFVVAMLEIIFKNNKNISEKIINFLDSDNILHDDIFNDDFVKIKYNIIEMIKSLLPKQIENEKIMNIYRNNYDEIEKISEGSFGIVYKVFHKYENSYYAIKKIFITEELLKQNFDYLKEIKIFSKLNHQNIVRFYSSFISFDDKSIEDFNSDEEMDIKIENTTSILFIQMELCDKTLYDYINYEKMNEMKSLKYFEEILCGLKYLHSLNIIHRDIKPSNIYLLDNIVKIGDFGLSTITIDNNKPLSDDIGTNFYIAPEISEGVYNNKIDIYGCGIILIELFINTKTTIEKYKLMKSIINDVNYNHDCIKKYKCLINKMLNKNVDERLNIIDTMIDFLKIKDNL
jgi:serine/threonine protein kinase